MSSCKTKAGGELVIPFAESDSSCRESLFFFFFCPCSVAYGILFKQLGIEPRPSAVEVLRPNHWTTKEVLEKILLSFSFLWELKGIQLVAVSQGKGRESQSLGKSIRLVK